MADDSNSNKQVFKFDEYWLQVGQTFADNTLSGLEERFKRLMSFLNYLGGSLALGGLTFTGLIGTNNPWVFGLIFIPLAVILFAKYFVGIESSRTIFRQVDLRSPIQIQNVHNYLVDKYRSRLAKAQGSVYTALCVTAICLPLATYIHNTTKDKIIESITVDNLSISTIISGKLYEGQTLRVDFYGKMKVKNENAEEVDKDTVLVKEIPVTKDKEFKNTFRDDALKMNPSSVKVTFIEDGLIKTVEKAL